MGHLLSKNGNRGNRLKKRKRKLLKRKKRNCFLQGPCMLCFIVHGNSGSLGNGNGGGGVGEDDDAQRSEVVSGSGSGSERLAALSSPDDCAKFLLSPRELAIWEGLSAVPARLVVPRALFRATPACEYAEMVCKRKCADVRRCAPASSRAAAPAGSDGERGGAGAGGARDTAAAAAAHRQLPSAPCLRPRPHPPRRPRHRRPRRPRRACAGRGPSQIRGEPGSTGSTTAATPRSSSPSCHQDHAHGDAQPGENSTDNSSINHLPSSILLKVFSHLSVKERCLSVSLVCKYWRDLCLDFQFWKQIDLSGLQQVTDELLVKIASWKLNVTEINLSDCRNLSDLSLATAAAHCPLLQKAHVGNQDKLTDDALKKLGQCCPELRDIHLGQCYLISDVGMEALAQGCPKLQRIYMQENKLVSAYLYLYLSHL
ncbi:hypothetical protein ANANG_G00198130 [Anguilla anguilla]|uniref:F-box domain-containing protein n=1 Tax=Anguilla anguilla TaxID=7936 RepID=A0A9D3RS41_ANGAN|nr:hypothetical protein ANANG_G00198130 [Anguilla anguilla]